jgi:thimet oligopeptidase
VSDPNEVLFDYSTATPDTIRVATDEAIERCDALLAAIVAAPDDGRTFANTVLPLDDVGEALSDVTGYQAFLAYVSPEEAIRDAAHAAEEQVNTYSTGIGFRADVYAALQAFADSGNSGGTLDEQEARLLERALRDFRRNGMALDVEQRDQLRTLKERLVTLGIEFSRNIVEYDDGIEVSREELSGLPTTFIDGLKRVDEDDAGNEERYRVSLDYPEFYPFLESADDPTLREELFRKFQNKAAPENVDILTEAIEVRDKVASILGYDSWAAYSLEVKMAKRPAAALEFLIDLEQHVRPKADRDLVEFAASMDAHLGRQGATVEAWDWRYYMQRVLREEHEIDQFEVAKYFPLDTVLEGLFDAYQRLVDVTFVPQPNKQAWHPDVRLFAIEDEGEVVGYFYMDLHPRPDKFGHAAAFTLRAGRELPDGNYRVPVSAVVANFTKPTEQTPSLLRHSEVVTLFHEFGHILHQVMTRARFARFSGTSVERDFVEAPSQMLQHWCWEPEVLQRFARHYESGEPIPADLVARMVAAKNVGSGVGALRQIYFARLDLAYHAPGAEKDTDAIAEELHPITGFEFAVDTHFQAGFGHLFGYDAGYYGYMWSKVYGDDMFARFEAAGIDDAATGSDYRRLILERGGSVDGDTLVRDFLGREPDTAAFLRDLGLTE